MNLHTLRRWIVFFTALVLGMFLGAVEGDGQQPRRMTSLTAAQGE